MPPTGRARGLAWGAVAALALGSALPPAEPAPARPSAAAEGCRLVAGGGAPCPCRALGGRLRLLLGLPVPLEWASAEDLEALPGIGPARAAAIVASREAGGPFADARALARVPGIGAATAARLRRLVAGAGADPACAGEGGG